MYANSSGYFLDNFLIRVAKCLAVSASLGTLGFSDKPSLADKTLAKVVPRNCLNLAKNEPAVAAAS